MSFEEMGNGSGSMMMAMAMTAGSISSSESSEDIGDQFRARVRASNSSSSNVPGPSSGRLFQYQQHQHQLNGSEININVNISGPLLNPLTNGHNQNQSHSQLYGNGGFNVYSNSNSNPTGIPEVSAINSNFTANGVDSSSGTGTGASTVTETQSPRKQFKQLIVGSTPREARATRNGFGNFITRSNLVTAASVIRDVWQDNLYEEFVEIRKLVHKYNYIAMDTEFPGVVIWLDEDFRNSGENQFDMIRTNVDALKLIQLGITFMDENGVSPPGVSTWQFNFRFDLKTDRNAQDSIELLKDSGLQFDRHFAEGINPDDFCELFICSGLVLNPSVFWITYHGGYDFAYLMRMLLGRNLPTDGDEFSQTMKIFFPCCYDVKVMLSECGNFRGGLQDISLQLGVKRIGTQHQAGSDSLLTGMTFFQIKQRYFGNYIEDKKYNGKIFGLSFSPPESGDTTG